MRRSLRKLFNLVWVIECFLVIGIVVDNSEIFAQVESPLLPVAVFLGVIGIALKHWDKFVKKDEQLDEGDSP